MTDHIRVKVLEAPEPIVQPSDIAGSHDASDPIVAARVAAVTEEIEGPGGWLGRSLGPQTLRAEVEDWPEFRLKLPYGPVIAIESVTYTDVNGETQDLDAALWGSKDEFFWMREGNPPKLRDEPFPVQVTYRAGYDGEDLANGGTGPVPERARQAIILSVQNLTSIGAENLFVKVEEAEGIGRTEFVVSDAAAKIVHEACQRLLQTLRVY